MFRVYLQGLVIYTFHKGLSWASFALLFSVFLSLWYCQSRQVFEVKLVIQTKFAQIGARDSHLLNLRWNIEENNLMQTFTSDPNNIFHRNLDNYLVLFLF